MRLGFAGLGIMGRPMARNLLAAGADLTVWNRTPERADELVAHGARPAATIEDLFAASDAVILMLADEAAVDATLDRGTERFGALVRSTTVVHMGTVSPEYSAGLDADIRRAGGRYVEAPVSGSRVPAENGDLVAMLAGDSAAVEDVRPHLAPMCRDTVVCGPVPNALLLKLAVNIVLITTVTGLAESVAFAARNGLVLEQLRAVLDAGPMASNISRGKLPKLLDRDFDAQAACADVLKNNRLIVEAARRSGAATPLLDQCHALFAETLGLGLGAADMAAVVAAIEARSV